MIDDEHDQRTTDIRLITQARHIPSASMRALKVIKLEPGDDFNVIQQEILMMLQCSHPNIIAYFGSYLK